jgi:hypothetical protein
MFICQGNRADNHIRLFEVVAYLLFVLGVHAPGIDQRALNQLVDPLGFEGCPFQIDVRQIDYLRLAKSRDIIGDRRTLHACAQYGYAFLHRCLPPSFRASPTRENGR